MVAREYGRRGVILTGASATREQVLAAIGRAPIIHLATHAVVMLDEPLRSYLALAPSASGTGAFSLQEIERTSLAKTSVVMLDGCRTAFTTNDVPVSSLALGFLAAGAANVIGSAWNISDSPATQALAVAFHRRLRAGASPAAALRDAQLVLLRSSDREWRHPGAWSGFQLYAMHK
jgi:CHAT domain-containing protein